MDLLPCPFCGSAAGGDAGPALRERHRQDRMLKNKSGRPYRRVGISHVVECTYCGVEGPQVVEHFGGGDEPELTADMVERSAAAAALAWNARQPINDQAYALVNRLITDTLATISRTDGNYDGTPGATIATDATSTQPSR